MEACYRTATDLYAELSGENPRFKKIANSYFRSVPTSTCGGRSQSIRSKFHDPPATGAYLTL